MNLSDKSVRLLATFFYIGRFPLAPGSMASLAGILLAIVLTPFPVVYMILTLVITAVGFQVSGPMEKLMQEKDPSCVVIDEVAGMLIAFFLLPLNGPVIIAAFFLFRAFDMFKIYPVNKFEKMEGGTGIMMDDLVAGIYTNVIMHIAVRWAGVI
jgi:phosphatidylglycerophosphatase A